MTESAFQAQKISLRAADVKEENFTAFLGKQRI